jgi:hypothetical protein
VIAACFGIYKCHEPDLAYAFQVTASTFWWHNQLLALQTLLPNMQITCSTQQAYMALLDHHCFLQISL